MFGVGGEEIFIILLVSVLLIKPEDLPGFLRKAGRLLGEIKKFSRALNRAIHQEEFPIKPEKPPEEKNARQEDKENNVNEKPEKERLSR